MRDQARFWILFGLVFFLLVYLFRDILMPFVAGMLVAYFLDPLADKLEKAGLNRTLSVTVITVAFFVLSVLLMMAALPLIGSQIGGFMERIPGYIAAIERSVKPMVTDYLGNLAPEEMEELIAAIKNNALQALKITGNVVRRLLSSGGELLSLLSLLFITPVVSFYLLRDWDRMVAQMDSWLPKAHAQDIRSCIREIDTTIAGFIRGQASVCMVLGVGYGVALSIVGLEFGFLIGLFTGVFSFIPYVGMLAGLVIGMGVAVAQFSDLLDIGLVALVFAIGQVIEGNFLTPKLVGDRVKLHPVWVMFALLAGGVVFGFIGILLAVPVAACIGVLVRRGIRSYLGSAIYDPDRPV